MAVRFSDEELDPALSEAGVWLEYAKGREIKIACMEKDAYQNKLGRMMTKAVMRSRSREMEATERNDITYRAMVGTIVMGLRNWTDDSGDPFEFTDENILFLLKNMPKARRFITDEASDYDNFTYESRKESATGDNGELPVSIPEARLKSGDEVLPGAGADS